MERIAWALIRCRLRSELAIELRICLETLWALPAPNTLFDSAVLPSSVLVGMDGTVELGVPYPADQRYFQRYLAPELARETPSVAAGIYAVGALLFEAVSGRPFESSEAVAREVDYLAARARATGLHPDAADTELLEIAARATRAEPEERWATPEIFSRELDRAAGQRTATREALAELVRGWVHRQHAGGRTPPNVALWRPASVFPPSSTPLDGQVAGHDGGPPPSGNDTLAQLRIPTLRGYTLDLSSYPPPRTATEAEVSAARVDRVDRGTPPPASGVCLGANSGQRPRDHRSAALVTALVVALPLIGMTLWNWRASAHAANRGVRASGEQAPLIEHVRRSTSPVLATPKDANDDRMSAGACATCRASGTDPSTPRIDLTHGDTRRITGGRRAPKRPPTFKPQGPFDYGI